jgi:hypothetical protein
MSTAAQERVHRGHAFNPNAHLNAEKQKPSTFLIFWQANVFVPGGGL